MAVKNKKLNRCPDCGGSGEYIDVMGFGGSACATCEGSGRVQMSPEEIDQWRIEERAKVRGIASLCRNVERACDRGGER